MKQLILFEKAIRIKPDYAEAYYNYGIACGKLGKEKKKAKRLYLQAEQLKPNYVEAFINLGIIFDETGDIKKGLKYHNKVLEIDPKNAQANHNKGFSLLKLGSFKEGWQQYEYRWNTTPLNKVKWPFAREEMWNNEEGKRVSLWKEQGIGDEIIFLGLVPEAKERSQSLAVYIDPRLVPLCERSMPGIKFLVIPRSLRSKLLIIICQWVVCHDYSVVT